MVSYIAGFPDGSDGKESARNVGDPGSIPGLGRSLEEGMVTLFNVLAWEVQWTEEPGGLQSMGSQRVGQNLATEQQQCYIYHPVI